MLDGWYLCVPCTLYNGTYLTWGVMSALNMQSSDIYLHLVFLAFAPSCWQDCEMKSWTANTCIPSGVFAFFSHLRHQNEKTNLHFFIQFFFCLNKMCVWFFYDDLIEKLHAQRVNNDTMVPPALSHSLLVYHPPPNLSVCASTRLQTSVFSPRWLQGRRRCRPIINWSVFPLHTNRLI
jgi:hypothetical protein